MSLKNKVNTTDNVENTQITVNNQEEEKKNEEEENKKLKRARQIEVEAAYEKFLELENKYYEDYHEIRKSWKKEDNAPYVSNADVITDWLKWIFE